MTTRFIRLEIDSDDLVPGPFDVYLVPAGEGLGGVQLPIQTSDVETLDQRLVDQSTNNDDQQTLISTLQDDAGTLRTEYDAHVTTSDSLFGSLQSDMGDVQDTLPLKADLVGGVVPDAQIPSGIARDSEVASAVAALVNSAPGTLDTLGEIATALAADESAATALATLVGQKAPSASPTLTGLLTVPTVKITGGSPGAGKVLTSDAVGAATWETPGGSSPTVVQGFYVSGSYYDAAVTGYLQTTVQSAFSNYIVYVPFVPWITQSFDQIGIEVATGISGTLRLGVYAQLSTGKVGALLASTSALSTASPGALTEAISLTLTGGTLYWLAVHCSANTSVKAIPLTAIRTWGAPALIQAQNTAFGSNRGSYSALPDPAPTAAYVFGTWNAPAIKLRAA